MNELSSYPGVGKRKVDGKVYATADYAVWSYGQETRCPLTYECTPYGGGGYGVHCMYNTSVRNTL